MAEAPESLGIEVGQLKRLLNKAWRFEGSFGLLLRAPCLPFPVLHKKNVIRTRVANN